MNESATKSFRSQVAIQLPTHLVDVRSRNTGIFYSLLENNVFRYEVDQTGLRIGEANDTHNVNETILVNNVFIGKTDSSGTGLHLSEQTNDVTVIGGDCEAAETAVFVGGTSTQLYGMRFEGGYGENGAIANPIEVGNYADRATINPNFSDTNVQDDFVRESIWRGRRVKLEPALRIAEDHCHGQFPAQWSSNPSQADIAVGRDHACLDMTTAATAGSTAAYSFDGVGRVNTLDASRLDAHIYFPSSLDYENSVIRFGWRTTATEHAMFVADIAGTGATSLTTANWIAKTIGQNGEATSSPDDTGYAVENNNDVILSVVCEGKSPCRYRYLIDGDEVAHHMPGSNVTLPEPYLSIETTDATARTMHCTGVVAYSTAVRNRLPL